MLDATPSLSSVPRRVEEARRVAARLAAEIKAWFDEWERSPAAPYHKTRLRVLQAALGGYTNCLTEKAAGLPGTLTPSGAYREARAVEGVAAWVRKLWEYYRSRFDQRLVRSPVTPSVGDVLAAADEVLWSCYSPVGKTGTAAPLAFIDDQARMTAIFESGPATSRLKETGEARTMLGDAINALPIPLVGLSPVVLDAPWWLAVIGHEVGHHIHDRLECLDTFRSHMMAIAKGVSTSAEARWESKASEVFADWCSAAALGQWSAIALAEQLWNADRDLIAARILYPPDIVRIELIARLANAFGLPTNALSAGYRWSALELRAKEDAGTAKAMAAVIEDLKVVDALVETIGQPNEFELLATVRKQLAAALIPINGNDPLRPRSDFLLAGQTDSNALAADKSLQMPEAPRVMAAAAVSAWQRAETDLARSNLANNVVLVLRHAVAPGERGSRSSHDEETNTRMKGVEQANKLMELFRNG